MSMSHKVSGPAGPAATPLFPADATIDRSSPVAEQVYALLRQAIVTWRLSPGDPIPEPVLIQQFQVSRTPLREAYRRLAQDGLVVIRPQAGTFVSMPDRRAWEEGRLIRRALEVEGIRRAATRIADDDIDALAALLDREERAVRRAAPAVALDLDDQFHATVSRLSGFPRLWAVIDGAKAQIDRLRFAALADRGLTAVGEHRQILDALRASDAEAAATLLAAHLDSSDRDLARSFAQDGGVFRAGPPPDAA